MNSKKSNNAQNTEKQKISRGEFDFEFYTSFYPDLKKAFKNQREGYLHWIRHGKKEERFPSLKALFLKLGKPPKDFDWHGYLSQNPDLKEKELNQNQTIHHYLSKGKAEKRDYPRFSWRFYVDLYEDLREISSYKQAYHHWKEFGIREKRIANLRDFESTYRIEADEVFEDFNWKEYLELNPDLQRRIDTKWQALLHFIHYGILEGRKFTNQEDKGGFVCLKVGDFYQIRNQLNEAIHTYRQGLLRTKKNYKLYQHLGDALLKQNRWSEAITYYEYAIDFCPQNFWSNYNLGQCFFHIKSWSKSYARLQASAKINPALNISYFSALRVLDGSWQEKINASTFHLSSTEDRDIERYILSMLQGYQLVEDAVDDYAERIRQDWLPSLDIPQKKLSLSQEIRVLLVVDDFLPQCLHYRVNQKIEQLKLAGFDVDCVPWRTSQVAHNLIHFCDVVIFYRVPAIPEIIRLILYTKALHKVVFYEIDDLVFEQEFYPDTFASYGDQITQEEYLGLVRGTVLFKKAMSLCDYGIASTPSLARFMEEVVVQNKCWVHRNALDHLNIDFVRRKLPKLKRDKLTIFYGTGTKAHNSDFEELIAPALGKLFQKYESIHFVVMGYLTIPECLEEYTSHITQITHIRDVQVYWEFLNQADINIAVLHQTPFNDCKSELKWFEAAVLKVPSVVSATQTYTEILEDGVHALIASDTEEWFLQLERLACDADLRKKIAHNAYLKAWKEYNLYQLSHNIRSVIIAAIEDWQQKNQVNTIEASSQKISKQKSREQARMPKQKIKLLIVNVFYPPQSIGGATRVVADNVEVLQAEYSNRYEVSVFTSDHDNPTPYQIHQYSHQGVKVTKVSVPMRERMDWFYQDGEMYKIFKSYLEYEQPDIIHFHCIQRLTASMLEAAVEKKIPYIVTVHDAWWISDYQFLVNEKGIECDYRQNDPYVAYSDTNLVNVNESLQRKQYLIRYLNQAKYILAVSETFAQLYRDNGFPQTIANRNGIMPRPVVPRKPSLNGRIRLGHGGGIAAHKGFDLFKEAVTQANLQNTEVLVIDLSQDREIGSDEYIKMEYWGTTPVKYIPRFKQEDIYEFFSMIDVLVAPSIWPESFGLITREATAAGAWVIASNKGAIGEDIIPGKTGDLFDANSPEDFVEILKKAEGNREKYQELAKSEVPTRTTKEQIKEAIGFYRNVLHE